MSEIYRMTPEPSIENIVLDPGVRKIARRHAIDLILTAYEKFGIPEEDREAAKIRLIEGMNKKSEDGTTTRVPWKRTQIAETLRTAEVLLTMIDPTRDVDNREIIIFEDPKKDLDKG